jgi:hypothetical protein
MQSPLLGGGPSSSDDAATMTTTTALPPSSRSNSSGGVFSEMQFVRGDWILAVNELKIINALFWSFYN